MRIPKEGPDSRGQRGQALVLFTLALALLLGFAALTIDVGLAFVERRSLQNAVDAAALAAAGELLEGQSEATAIATAIDYLERNGYSEPDVTVEVNIPPTSGAYAGQTGFVQVKASTQATTAFLGLFRDDPYTVEAEAVAQWTYGYALFQTDPECEEELEIEGNSIYVNGSVHGDGEVELEGNNGVITGSLTWVCEFENEGLNWTIGSGPTRLPEPVPPPVSFEYSDFEPCTFSSTGDLIITKFTDEYWRGGSFNAYHELLPGVYCAQGDIRLEVTQVTGNVTFVAHGNIEIEITGNNYDLTAYRNGVLAFTDAVHEDDGHCRCMGGSGDEGEIDLEGNYGQWRGMLIAPYGEVELEGNNLTSPSTLLLAKEIEVEGNSISMTGQHISGASGQLRLAE